MEIIPIKLEVQSIIEVNESLDCLNRVVLASHVVCEVYFTKKVNLKCY